jgi:hypothetical protein
MQAFAIESGLRERDGQTLLLSLSAAFKKK